MRKFVIAIGGLILSGLFALSIFLSAVYFGLFGKIYTEKELGDFENQFGSVILSSEGKVLGHVFHINRSVADFDELPQSLIDALVATEDSRFYEHEGVDGRSLLRVIFKTILLGDRSAGGGSTITQQLAKNMFGRENHGPLTIPVNKTKEIILANRLESVYTKEEILDKYLNTVSFGENTFGISAASKRFFSKSPDKLTIEESATLIGMLKATTTYNPRLYPERAFDRRNLVISQMEKYGYLDKSEADMLHQKPLELHYFRESDDGIAAYFIEQVKREAQRILAGDDEQSWSLETDGLVIETTLNYELQVMAVSAMNKHLKAVQPVLDQQYYSGTYSHELDSIIRSRRIAGNMDNDTARIRNVFSWGEAEEMTALDSIRRSLLQLHAGILALEPATGAVLTYVGGIDFTSNPYDQVQAKRQLASAFKPVLYTAALADGKTPCDYIDNDPFTLTDFEDWRPANYNEESGGKYSLAAALALSKNIPTVRLLFETGFEKVRDVWKALGFSSRMESNPSLALGAIEASLYELARGYSVFANGGYRPSTYMIRRIKSRDGKVLYEHEDAAQDQVLNPEVTYQLSAILQKAVNEGTGASMRSRYRVSVPLAGKTGTSQNFADAWFVGYNPGIIITARVGASMPVIHFASGQYGSGSTLALPLVGLMLVEATKDKETYSLINTSFPAEAATDKWIDCEDFKEDSGLERIINVFKSEKTTLEKEEKRANRKGFFRRLFGDKE